MMAGDVLVSGDCSTLTVTLLYPDSHERVREVYAVESEPELNLALISPS